MEMSKPTPSGNDSAEEELLKSEQIEQPSEEKNVTKPEKTLEEKTEKCLEKCENEKLPDKTLETMSDLINIEHEDPAVPDTKNEAHATKEKTSDVVKPRINLTEEYVKNTSDSVPCCPKTPREKVIRNQSDIFSLKDISTTLQTSIFSVNGSPSRRVFRKQQPAGHVFQKNEDPPSDKTSTPRGSRITKENYNDEKRPSSSYRNPLTGTGLTSSDEYKSKGTKRKDGNPLLGLGYDDVTAESSQ